MIDLANLLAHQQVLTGMVGATVAGGVLFQLRALPGQLKGWLQEAATVTLTVESDSEAYSYLNVWLGRTRATRRARRLMLQSGYDYERDRWDLEFTLGHGWHVLREGGQWLFVHREVHKPSDIGRMLGSGSRQTLTLITLGRDQDLIRSIVPAAKAAYMGVDRVEVFFWHDGQYLLANKRPKRLISTVFAPQEQLDRLVADVERFLVSRPSYAARGIPWRRGYLLKGPPGTGKTTLVQVIAGQIGRPIYSINLQSIAGDNQLLAAFNAVPVESVVVIEDIDAAKVTRNRALAPEPPPSVVPGAITMATPDRVTLSGLLNAIDGVAARDGRLLFITSNHAEDLDPALLRAGRIDVQETVDRLGEVDARVMFEAFRPDAKPGAFEAMVGGKLPIAAAELQNLLLSSEASAAREAAQ